MKLSENIQANRKRLNISQEELGNMLFVSRQTVSLWEKGSTLPTIDNLVRLSEIFSVSVDELLKGATDLREKTALESYTFRFSDAELKEIGQRQYGHIYRNGMILAVGAVLLMLNLLLNGTQEMLSGFVAGMLLFSAVVQIKNIMTYRKLWHKAAAMVGASTYQYVFYEDHFDVDIFRGSDLAKSYHVRFCDIENVQSLPEHCLLQFDGHILIIRKRDLKENAALYSYLYHNPAKVKIQEAPNRWKTASRILFVLSLCSIFMALLLVAFATERNGLFVENAWLFFTVTPIPIASVVFGCVACRRGHTCKKNIIAGVIMTVLLCLYGSIVFAF